MRYFLRSLSLIAVFLIMVSCSKKEYEPKSGDYQKNSTKTTEPSANSPIKIPEKKIIKEGEVYFESMDLSKTRTLLHELIGKYKAYISKEEEHSYGNRIEQKLVIRIPVEQFDAFLSELSQGIKVFDGKRVEATDVTEEYFDVETRLKIKKETENQYRLLLTRAKTVDEILSVNKYIAELRTEIESLEGKLNYLQNRIAYSMLAVTFYKRVSSGTVFSPQWGLGLKNGWNHFIWFLIGLVNIWPFIIVIFASGYAVIVIRKRRKKAGQPGNDKGKP